MVVPELVGILKQVDGTDISLRMFHELFGATVGVAYVLRCFGAFCYRDFFSVFHVLSVLFVWWIFLLLAVHRIWRGCYEAVTYLLL